MGGTGTNREISIPKSSHVRDPEGAQVASKSTCKGVLQFGDKTLHCELPEDHVEPTEDLPQGTPHKTSEHHDNLTGDPWTWWG